jgi:molybdopterin synthase sulfur carrier subunit
MAKARLKLPIGLTYPEGQKELDCEGATVGEALDDLIRLEPRLGPRIFKDDRMWVGVFLNGRNIRALQGLETPLHDGDKMNIVPPISGG